MCDACGRDHPNGYEISDTLKKIIHPQFDSLTLEERQTAVDQHLRDQDEYVQTYLATLSQNDGMPTFAAFRYFMGHRLTTRTVKWFIRRNIAGMAMTIIGSFLGFFFTSGGWPAITIGAFFGYICVILFDSIRDKLASVGVEMRYHLTKDVLHEENMKVGKLCLDAVRSGAILDPGLLPSPGSPARLAYDSMMEMKRAAGAASSSGIMQNIFSTVAGNPDPFN